MNRRDPLHRIASFSVVCDECKRTFLAKTGKTRFCDSPVCERTRRNRLARERAAEQTVRRLARERAMGRAS